MPNMQGRLWEYMHRDRLGKQSTVKCFNFSLQESYFYTSFHVIKLLFYQRFLEFLISNGCIKDNTFHFSFTSLYYNFLGIVFHHQFLDNGAFKVIDNLEKHNLYNEIIRIIYFQKKSHIKSL